VINRDDQRNPCLERGDRGTGVRVQSTILPSTLFASATLSQRKKTQATIIHSWVTMIATVRQQPLCQLIAETGRNGRTATQVFRGRPSPTTNC
jgi:hypothetical protein